MLIFVTNRCEMGCSHCMSNCVPTGEDMSLDTFKKAVDFSVERTGPTPILISGGEPTMNPALKDMVEYATRRISPSLVFVMSNGIYLSEHTPFLKWMKKKGINLQVVVDDRYYPTHVNEDIIGKYFDVCYDVMAIYPQGRAKTNNLPWKSKCSKCFNIRAIVRQLKPASFMQIANEYMIPRGKFCTPSIGLNGELRVGESFLCPVCSNIDKSDKEIIADIYNFHCDGCADVNAQLPDEIRAIIE